MFDAAIVRRWAVLGVELLAKHRLELNALNVFPIPDGDTGTNLYLTFKAAAQAESARTGRIDDSQDALNAMARGALMGARGNSGVILAQTLQAFAQSAKEYEFLNFSALMKSGAIAARSAVSNPQEGTVLTVLDAVANSKAEDPSSAGDVARDALAKTPQMLPALKMAGVVDAGGRGVVLLLDALAAAWNQKPNESASVGFVPTSVPQMIDCKSDGKFELMFLIPSFSLDEVTKTIDSMGTSLVVTTGDDVSQVHIHLEDPAQAISKIRNIATPKNIRIELLEVTKRERAVVVQAFGSGVVQQLAELGAFVVACEPDERSSVSDFVDAAIHSDAKEIILVAGDRDSVQVTELAAKMLKEIGIQAAVVPAVSIPAALIAVSMFDESGDLKSATDKMIAACEAVTSVAISKANRDSGTAIGEIKSGNFLLLVESEIVAFGESIELLIEKFQQISAGKEIATIIWGAEISKPEQNSILAALNNLEVVSIDGGQELWLALVGLE